MFEDKKILIRTALIAFEKSSFPDELINIVNDFVFLKDNMSKREIAKACLHGHEDIKDILFNNGNDDDNDEEHINECFYSACEGGHLDLIKEFGIDNPNVLDSGLYYACSAGRFNVAEYLILRGARISFEHFGVACRDGDIKIVNYLISKGATYWNLGLFTACENDNKEIAELMVLKGANNLRDSYKVAVEQKNFEIASFLLNEIEKSQTIKPLSPVKKRKLN